MLTYKQLVEWANEATRELKSPYNLNRKLWDGFHNGDEYRRRMVFVGNGITRLANPDAPSWRSWIAPLVEQKQNFSNKNYKPGEYLLEHLELPEIFDYLEQIGANIDYRGIWSKLWESTECSKPSLLHRTLLSFFNLLVTTNYDTLLERAGLELLSTGYLEKLYVIYFVGSTDSPVWKCITYENQNGKIVWDGDDRPLENLKEFPKLEQGSNSRIVLKLHGTFTLPSPDNINDDGPREETWLRDRAWDSTVTSSAAYQARLRSADNWKDIIPAIREYDMVALGYGFNPEDITIHNLVMEYETGQRYRFALLHGDAFEKRFRYQKYGFSVGTFDGGHGCDTEMRMAVMYIWLRQLFYTQEGLNPRWHIESELVNLFEQDFLQVMENAGYDPKDDNSGPRARCVMLGQVSENIVLGIESAPQMEHSYRVLGTHKNVWLEDDDPQIRKEAKKGIRGQMAVTQMGGQMLVPATFMAKWLCRKQKDNPKLRGERIVLASIIGWDKRGDKIYSFLAYEDYLDNSLVFRDYQYPTEWAAVATYQGLRTLLDVQTLQPSQQVVKDLSKKIDDLVAPRSKEPPRSIYLSKWFLEEDQLGSYISNWQEKWSSNSMRPWIFYETGGTGSGGLSAEEKLNNAFSVDFVLASIPALMRIGTLPICHGDDNGIEFFSNGKVDPDDYTKKMFKRLRQDSLNRKELMKNFFEMLATTNPSEIFSRLFQEKFSHMFNARAFVVTLNEMGALAIVKDKLNAERVKVYHIQIPDLGDDKEVRCALGAGDAFRGAFIDSILDSTNNENPDCMEELDNLTINATRRGVGVGTEKVRYFSVEDAFNSINEIDAEKETPEPDGEFSKSDAQEICQQLQSELREEEKLIVTGRKTKNEQITLKPFI